MSSIVINGDTSGAITVAAPAVAGSNTLTLPATTGTILDTNSSLASSKLTGALPAIDGSALTGVSAGKILQVVHATQNTEVLTTSTSLIDTGLTASITPSATSSKIAVFYNVPILTQANEIVMFALIRGTTNILNNVRALSQNPNGAVNFPANYLDSPSTTSATTYKVQFGHLGTPSSGSAVNWNNQSPSQIMLMEVAG
tara:strand:+ start:4011 stop:4607 length:597 start_codon:yes stop_codon:yes gene_type:complete